MERKGLLKYYIHYISLFLILITVNEVSITAINGKIAIAISAIWMVLSIIIYFASIRKRKSKSAILLYPILNAVIGGVAISSYYSLKNVVPYTPIVVIVVFGILMLTNYLLLCISNGKPVFTVTNLIFSIAMLLASIYIWIEKGRSLGSSLIFLSVVYLCFSIALFMVIQKERNGSALIPLSSLLMFGGLIFAVVVMLSEGDALEILDIDFPESNRKKTPKL